MIAFQLTDFSFNGFPELIECRFEQYSCNPCNSLKKFFIGFLELIEYRCRKILSYNSLTFFIEFLKLIE